MISILFWGGLIIFIALFPNDTVTYWVYLIFSAFLLFGVWCVWISLVWKIQIEGNQIYFRNCFLQKKKFTFESIGRVEIKQSINRNQLDEIILYSKDGEDLLYVSPFYSGFTLFMDRLKQEGIDFEKDDLL